MHDSIDLAAAIRGLAGLVFAVVDLKTVLEIAQFAVGLSVVF